MIPEAPYPALPGSFSLSPVPSHERKSFFRLHPMALRCFFPLLHPRNHFQKMLPVLCQAPFSLYISFLLTNLPTPAGILSEFHFTVISCLQLFSPADHLCCQQTVALCSGRAAVVQVDRHSVARRLRQSHISRYDRLVNPLI